MQYTYGSRLKKVVDWYSCEIVGYHPHLHDFLRTKKLQLMDVAWWMEAAPPQIIFPEKPSTCPILETILEERETEEDDDEHEKEDKRGNLDMRYTFFFMIRISELEVLPNHLNQLISDMQAPVRVDIYAVLLHIWINLIVKFRTNDTNTIFRTHCTHFCTNLASSAKLEEPLESLTSESEQKTYRSATAAYDPVCRVLA
ncbi:hypothetical protein YC2023_124664 [Brassica napus]